MSRHLIEQQFLRVYDEYGDAIFRHCFFRLRNDRERAKDIMQEAFTRAWEYIAAGKEVKNIRAFIYTIVNNLIIDDAKKKKEASLEQMMESGFAPQKNDHIRMEETVDAAHVIESLDKLEPRYRDVVYMRYFDGLKPREIAEITGESTNAISVRIHRGIKQCRGLIV